MTLQRQETTEGHNDRLEIVNGYVAIDLLILVVLILYLKHATDVHE